MKITNIHPQWGLDVSGTIHEILELGGDYWRNIGYDKDIILFRSLSNISDQQLYKLCSYFGTPWTHEEYKYSREQAYDFEYEGSTCSLTRISNKLSPRVGTSAMRWHADIPLRAPRSFPWRGLYMVSNPNPETGLTSWLNMRTDLIGASKEEMDYYRRIDLTMHSWLEPGEEVCDRPFVKMDPIQNRESISLNCYSTPEFPYMWIKNTRVDGIERDNTEILQPIFDKLEQRADLQYTHKWGTHDFIMYNNWHMVHNRTKIIIGENEVREFIRVNVDHDIGRPLYV